MYKLYYVLFILLDDDKPSDILESFVPKNKNSFPDMESM